MKYGVISEVDPTKGLVRVAFLDDDDGDGGTFVSGWIPFIVNKSKLDKVTFPMDVQEHVVCMMDEHCESGVVMGVIYSDKDLPDGAGPDMYRVKFKDGSYVQFNRATGKYKANFTSDVEVISGAKIKATAVGDVEVVSGGNVKFDASNINITGNVNVTGNIEATGNLKADGTVRGLTDVKAGIITQISLLTHVHPDITSGGTTGPPQ